MSTFRFRLATLQRLREQDRDEKRAHLADAERAEQIVLDRLAEIDQELDQLRQKTQQVASPGVVDLDALMEVQRYDMLLKFEQAHARQQHQVVSQEVLKRRETLLASDREVKVLELLRDKQAENHRQEEEKKSNQLIDEVAGRGYLVEKE
ncbi:MAG: flagellar export protein FliJ [Planctomycetota bacterium]|nr:flagellar export protein FliJ [Planctomycetota bacterium]